MKALSVILIAHNEEQAIGRMLEGLLANYDQEILEIIVVDDASKDSTAEIVEAWSKRNAKVFLIKRTPPCGVGRALKAGFDRISPKAECVLSMDSDFVENIGQVRALLTAFDQQKCDGVIGSRFVKGGKVIGYPFLKLLMNRLFHWVVKLIFRIKQNDLTNNFKLYRAKIFQSIPWMSDGFAMNAETGLLPILFGYQIVEVPVVWVDRSPQMGRSKFGLLKHGGGYVQVIFHALRCARSKKPVIPNSA
ncbi:MAG TPA: glycosyltransferase family 2 protein [Chthoniobacterales bacterium]|jgi:dolichol-phosphate mannosyltransferase|nr:glycosyltransferase family 2 protein [Chthoniobacterales bacterium]